MKLVVHFMNRDHCISISPTLPSPFPLPFLPVKNILTSTASSVLSSLGKTTQHLLHCSIKTMFHYVDKK